jgi:DeoR family fructose operon transcriptional repressor
MLTEERKNEILNIVNERKSITVQELRDIMNVSESTVRRDITALGKEGKLIKVFGGAVALDDPAARTDITVLMKESINRAEKLTIARYAAALIRPGDCVYLDAGSTTEYMIGFITEKNATYVTNSVSHAQNLMSKGLKTLLVGGELKEDLNVVIGADAVLHIQKYHFSKGFFGTEGVDFRMGFTAADVREALIKRVAIQNTESGERYVLADHEKFGQTSTVSFSDFMGTIVLTDKYPGESYSKKMDIKVVQ